MIPFSRLSHIAFAALTLLLSASQGVSAQSSGDERVSIKVFVDDDPGQGNGGTTVLTPLGNISLTVPLDGIDPGAHIVSFRVYDDSHGWSTTVTRPLFISDESFAFDGLEYFVDTDPGQGRAIWIDAGAGSSLTFDVPTASLASGPHTLTVRLRSGSEWTAAMTRPFTVIPAGMTVEYFYDVDPGVGRATALEAENGETVVFLPTSGLTSGAHILSMRAKDTKGRWSPTVTVPLYVTEPDADITAAEYFVDTDPGCGNATQVTVDPSGEIAFTIPTSSLEYGRHTMTLRGRDITGRWITVYEAPFEVIDASGIEEIRWRMTLDVTHQADCLTLTARDIDPASTVELYTLGGVALQRVIWHDTASPLILPLDSSVPCCILTVTAPTGERAVRKIR